jgi:hypothetical protein
VRYLVWGKLISKIILKRGLTGCNWRSFSRMPDEKKKYLRVDLFIQSKIWNQSIHPDQKRMQG